MPRVSASTRFHSSPAARAKTVELLSPALRNVVRQRARVQGLVVDEDSWRESMAGRGEVTHLSVEADCTSVNESRELP